MALKEIKTGYFAKTKVYSDNGYKPYSISRITPKGCKCGEIKDLAPSWELLKGYKNGTITSGDYTSKYWQMLSSKDVEILLKEKLITLTPKEKGIVLLCYEKNPEDCHRSILASYCNQKFNMKIEEYDLQKDKNINKDEDKDEYEQIELDL